LDGNYVLHAGNRVGFQVAAYDRTRPLIIDPVLSYSTYLGGSGGETGLGIAVDSSGNAYVAGSTDSMDFPKKGPEQTTLAGGADAFITKLTPGGKAVLYSTYLGGTGFDQVNGIAVDSDGNAYVTGQTQSTDFPTSAGAFQTTAGGNGDAFVAKLSASGSTLSYSTYLGGGGADFGQGIAVNSSRNAFVVGSTQSADFPTASPLQAARLGTADAFVTKVNASGTGLTYSTYLGGGGSDLGLAIALDGSSNAYVTGTTSSTNFPITAGALQITPGGSGDAYVSKLSASGAALVYSTYLGGSAFDRADAIAVDSLGAAYVTGLTNSTNFPTVGPFQGTPGGNGDAFVAKLAANGSALSYSTYLGGVDGEEAFGIVVDSAEEAFVTGFTQSDNFPLVNPVQADFGGGVCGAGACPDVFVTGFDSSGSSLNYSTFLGGAKADLGQAIALDSFGNAYVTGSTLSTNFPVITGSFQQTIGGGTSAADAFVAKIDLADSPSVTLSPSKLSFPNTASGTSSAAKIVTLTNFGSVSLNITSISVNGPFSETHSCGSTLAGGGAHCTISVTFKPTTIAALTGTLSISDDAPGSPHTVPLSGKGVAPAPIVTLTPASVDFGKQVVGTASAVQVLTLKNTGSAKLTITSVVVPGPDFSQSNACPASLNPDESCTIKVKFKPTKSGALAGAVEVVDNAPGTPHRAPLTGTGEAVFSLASKPTSRILNRSADSSTFTITATAPSTFTANIDLTCSVPTPATCTFSPTSVKGGGTSTLTLAGFSTGSGDFTMIVTGTSGDQNTSLSVPVTFTDFLLSLSPPLVTIQAGKPANYAVSLKPVNGFKQGTSLTCGFFLLSSDAATCFIRTLQDTSCSISPATLTPDGTTTSRASITITTTPKSFMAPLAFRPSPPVPLAIWVGLLMATGILVAARRRVPGNALPLATVLLLLALATSCDTTFTPLFQGPASTKGTPGGLYSVGVVGSVGTTFAHCSAATLAVNTSTSTTTAP
jgi:Beta-propeller repeat/Abnormal spindle-like microcephaly-assoc'd, ASPM-SPD-2-Hydin/Cep192 domain 4